MRDIILGTAVAILVLNGIAVLAGGLLSSFIPGWIIKAIAALAFMFFAVTSLGAEDDEDEEAGDSKIGFASLAVFCTFFVAELGDKTQLTAITFGANEGISNALIVWIACSIGLFLADMVGVVIGMVLKSKTPSGLINKIAFVIFAVFGVITAKTAFELVATDFSLSLNVMVATIVTAVILALISFLYWYKSNKKTA